tara:strand:- start:513 stop:1115 length:603 start_codon:yes stop_codon:yes gene_type:complete
MGRNLQKEVGQQPQCILTMPILEGTDGIEKMSKSYGNDIGISDSANDMYGKTLSIPDNIIFSWFNLATNIDSSELENIKKKLESDSINPMEIKRLLARKIVEFYYDSNSALEAENHFNTVIVSKGTPDNIEDFIIEESMLLVDIIIKANMLSSKSEARRMIKQSAVKIDGDAIDDIHYKIPLNKNIILKVGKRKFLRIIS